MNYRRVGALLVLSAFLTSCEHQQKERIRADPRDSRAAGVPSSMVRNVRQDKHGNILIASYRDVFRYDGKSFTNLTHTIPSPSFWDVLEDQNGNLWFATRDSGVYRYDGKAFRHYTTREGLARNNCFLIYEDRAGNIWFGTGGGLSRYNGKTFQNFTTKEGLPANDITSILEDKTGKFWIGTRAEACFYDGQTFTVFRSKEGKAFRNVRGITQDAKGHVWFGATTVNDKKGDTLIVTTGLWHYDGKTFTRINQRGTSSIIEDKQGNLWTTGAVNPNGTEAWKLLRYDQKTLDRKNPSVTEILSVEKMLCGILEAKDGSIWIGSMNGVYRYDGKNITDFKSKKGQ